MYQYILQFRSFSLKDLNVILLKCFLGLLWCAFFFWLHHVACEILFPWPGIKPIPLAMKAWSPNHWTGREFLLWNVIIRKHRASMTVFVTGWNPNFDNCQLTNRWPKCISTDQLYWAGASGRSPGDGNGNPFQYSCLKNPMDRGAWGATAHVVTKNHTGLRD